MILNGLGLVRLHCRAYHAIATVPATVMLLGCCLAGCGGGPALPRTSANVAACAALAKALDGKSALADLAGLVFESNTPMSDRLRQDIATYVADLAPGGDSGNAHQDASRAEGDCGSIKAPVARAYGGSG